MLNRMFSNGFLNNVLKVSVSNLFSLFSGVLVGFLVPKIMGLEDYANYKIYTLYLTYLALFSMGVGDGIYLKFSGTDRKNLNIQQIKGYLHIYYIQLIVFTLIVCIVETVFLKGENRFILMALSLTILPSQITGIHQNLSILTSRFNEYSTRVVIKSGLTSLLVLILSIIYKFNGKEIAYQIYIIFVVVIDYILAIWYMLTYKEFNFGRCNRSLTIRHEYKKLIHRGFPLLLSNMAGTLFLNIDRQVVSLFFAREDYAIYAFAYNMLTLITGMMSAISLVLFPSLKRIHNFDVRDSLCKHYTMFSLIAPIALIVYYPLCFAISWFLPHYIASLNIFRIVLPGIMLSATVSVVLFNYYKLENKVNLYFIKTIVAGVISVMLSYLAYIAFKSYEWISWTSLVSLMIWYLAILYYFIKKYSIRWLSNFIYLVSCMALFYVITGIIHNVIIGFILYGVVVVVAAICVYRNELWSIFKSSRIYKEGD